MDFESRIHPLTLSRFARITFGSEFMIWFFLALTISAEPLLYYFSAKRMVHEDLSYIIYHHNLQFLATTTVIFGALMFRQIFGAYPLRFLRFTIEKRSAIRQYRVPFQKAVVDREDASIEEEASINKRPEPKLAENPQSEDSIRNGKVDVLLTNTIIESRSIADKLFTRSGVYLFVGCTIAFLGVFIFYNSTLLNNVSPSKNGTDIAEQLIALLPRFGSLFFIEFIAIFFLRQYRIVLEEFRYYEGIKRKRQDQYHLFQLILANRKDADLLEILRAKFLEANESSILKKGESTQLIEVERIAAKDSEMFSKFIELLRSLKGK